MNDQQSFDILMCRLQSGEGDAATRIFHRYAHRLAGLAARKLGPVLRRKLDPEDVVQSVFRSFFVRQADGQYELQDWDSLWAILAVITVRKCINQGKFHNRERRDVAREVAPMSVEGESGGDWDFLSREPTPDEALVLTETIEQTMNALDDRDREIFSLALQGFTVREISETIQYAERTVRRTLQHIREHLQRMQDADNGEFE